MLMPLYKQLWCFKMHRNIQQKYSALYSCYTIDNKNISGLKLTSKRMKIFSYLSVTRKQKHPRAKREIKLLTGTALNIWEVTLTHKQELLGLNHIKSSWRRLQSSVQKSLYLWYFTKIVNILDSLLQLVLDIYWKKTQFQSYWVTERLSSCLHTCGCTRVGQKSPNPTFTQNSRIFHSIMCYTTVAVEFFVTPPCSQIFILTVL